LPGIAHAMASAFGVAARAPLSQRERVLLEFRSPRNRAYLADAFRRVFPDPRDQRLAFVLGTLDSAILEYSATAGLGGALLDSDPLALRGSAPRGRGALDELKHLNQAFFQQRVGESSRNFAPREKITEELDAVTGDDAPWGDNEELYYKLFVRDSLRPKGFENLNAHAPLWALHEDQRPFAPKAEAAAPHNFAATYDPSVPIEDQAWSAGDEGRSAGALCEQYFGEEGFLDLGEDTSGGVVQEYYDPIKCRWDAPPPTNLQAAAARARSAGSSPTVAELLRSSSGGRAERRGIPLYQRSAPRYNVLHGRADVDETLGSGSHEFGGELMSPVRGWNVGPAHARHPRH
jgi:hypothetical protein